MTLTLLDRASGRYFFKAQRGLGDGVLGMEVAPGDGAPGHAIQSRKFIGPTQLVRAEYTTALREIMPFDTLVSVSVPLIRDDLVLGAISVGRANLVQLFLTGRVRGDGAAGSAGSTRAG